MEQEIINELNVVYDYVMEMREEGEPDLRQILYFIESRKQFVKESE